ncbi:hypothetical protein RB601_003908 [Gaeumannomyces tritici]
MLFRRFASYCCPPPAPSNMMQPTMLGASGRVYVKGDVLQRYQDKSVMPASERLAFNRERRSLALVALARKKRHSLALLALARKKRRSLALLALARRTRRSLASSRHFICYDPFPSPYRPCSVVKAESGGQSFVLKCPLSYIYDKCRDFAAEFAGSRRLRLHVDRDLDEQVLVYPFFKTTLFDLIAEDPELPIFERVKIMTTVAEAIQEVHKKNWAHLDISPNNVLVDWTCNGHGDKTVTNVAVGGLSSAMSAMTLETDGMRCDDTGSREWRSPEVYSGRGMSMASDIYSFGLVMLYTLGAGSMLRYAEGLAAKGGGVTLCHVEELMARHFAFFGPATEGLFKVIRGEEYCRKANILSYHSQLVLKSRPDLSFQSWGQGLGPEVHARISWMLKMDPAARPTIDQVLAFLRSGGVRSSYRQVLV